MGDAASDQIVPGRLLAARCTLRGTEWGGTALDHFVQVPCRLDVDRHGFGAGDLLAVKAAWIGRRAVGRLRRALEERHARPMTSRQAYAKAASSHPELAERHGFEWDGAMARELNELLDRFDAPESAP